jgi:hypothetical protein
VIVCGATLTTFAVLDPDRAYLWDAWLRGAEEVQESVDGPVRYFAAIQVDARGLAPFGPLLDRLTAVGGEWWAYSLDDGRETVTQANRGRHITMGQNLIAEYATSVGASHLLHLAADCEPPTDVLPKLLEVGQPLVAAECSTYCMTVGREPLPSFTEFPVVGPPITAACLLVERALFKRLRWRFDPDLGMSDDPSYTLDAQEFFGVTALTRTDEVALHHPAAIGAIEHRFPGLDMGVRRIPVD